MYGYLMDSGRSWIISPEAESIVMPLSKSVQIRLWYSAVVETEDEPQQVGICILTKRDGKN
jgi:hypothetical protein